MTKQDYLDMLRLLSALESWGFTVTENKGSALPDYLHDLLGRCIVKIEKEILK